MRHFTTPCKQHECRTSGSGARALAKIGPKPAHVGPMSATHRAPQSGPESTLYGPHADPKSTPHRRLDPAAPPVSTPIRALSRATFGAVFGLRRPLSSGDTSARLGDRNGTLASPWVPATPSRAPAKPRAQAPPCALATHGLRRPRRSSEVKLVIGRSRFGAMHQRLHDDTEVSHRCCSEIALRPWCT